MSSWSKHAVIVSGFVLSVFFLWLAFRQVDGESLRRSFTTIDLLPVLFCGGALAVGILLRSVRWRVIAGYSTQEQRNFSRATNLGVLANLILPGRAGEFIRVIALAKLSQSSLPGPLASALIDRLVDVFVLAFCASALYWMLPISGLIGKWLTVFLIAGSVIAIFVVIFAKGSSIGAGILTRIAKRWIQHFPLKLEVFIAELRNEFRRLLGCWLSLKLVLLAVLILCVDYFTIAALLGAFNLSLPVEVPLLLWVFLAAGSALPSAPGYVGVYQLAAVWALSSYAIPPSTAVAVATVLQIITLAVVVVMAGPGTLTVFKRTLFQESAADGVEMK